ncbi:hypothetical protein [Blautia producta]|uniref:hypothetical protein n=1 Tax=Blautia producta TaxID=33035 RepID=UPI0021093E74|nr:hypothetical protein [Blautia producta]MCQ4741910.1 hypothetical protein [Blautia producta]
MSMNSMSRWEKKGIFVKGYSQGNVNDLEDAVMASLNEEVGAQEMPNVFSAYADAAYTVDSRGKLADISAYMTKEELDEYVIPILRKAGSVRAIRCVFSQRLNPVRSL